MDDKGDAAPKRMALTRKDFLNRVVARSGHARRSEARAIADATLAELAQALSEGADLAVPPLGRLRVVKEKDTPRARVLTLRLSIQKRGDAAAAGPGEEPGAGLADPSEGG